tara:strand:- start:9789 stop:10025 length:237 start_codon:yes stop_codon:yes gene_type:complete
MFIDFNGNFYTIPKEDFENDTFYLKRLWFVAKQEPHNKKSYEEAIHNSILWKNITFLNCEYSFDILNRIKNIEKKFVL